MDNYQNNSCYCHRKCSSCFDKSAFRWEIPGTSTVISLLKALNDPRCLAVNNHKLYTIHFKDFELDLIRLDEAGIAILASVKR